MIKNAILYCIFFFLTFSKSYSDSFIPGDNLSVSVLNAHLSNGNTLLLIEFSGEAKTFPVEIRVKQERTRQNIILKKTGIEIVEGESKSLLSLPLILYPGNFLITVEVADPGRQLFFVKSLLFQCNPPSGQPWLSDIRFFTCPDEKPLVSENMSSRSDQLHFAADLRSKRDELLAARAVLFRKDASGSGLPKYVSVEQISSVLDPLRSDIFEDDFSLKGLEPGEYLVELYLYRREKLFLAVNRSFRIRWPGLDALLANPDSAFQLMSPVSPHFILSELSKRNSEEEKRTALLEYWKKMNQRGGSFPTQAMESYFSRLDEAAEKFPQPSHPWENDRVKAYLCFGQPDLRKNVTIANIETEIWYYDAWGLKIRFRKENRLWKTMEQTGPKV